MSVYTVYLRRPAGKRDRRCDPFWESGSFGSTGCHTSNLLQPRRSPLTVGDRLVFLQGSHGEVRAIAMTPPIRVGGQLARLEALWDPEYRPLPYAQAALFINNAGRTDFPSLLAMLAGVRCDTPCSSVGSKFRSRCTPLDLPLAAELAAWFDRSHDQAAEYFDAICHANHPWYKHVSRSSWSDPEVRAQRYREFGGSLGAELGGNSTAGPSSRCESSSTGAGKSDSLFGPDPEPGPGPVASTAASTVWIGRWHFRYCRDGWQLNADREARRRKARQKRGAVPLVLQDTGANQVSVVRRGERPLTRMPAVVTVATGRCDVGGCVPTSIATREQVLGGTLQYVCLACCEGTV